MGNFALIPFVGNFLVMFSRQDKLNKPEPTFDLQNLYIKSA